MIRLCHNRVDHAIHVELKLLGRGAVYLLAMIHYQSQLPGIEDSPRANGYEIRFVSLVVVIALPGAITLSTPTVLGVATDMTFYPNTPYPTRVPI